MDCVHMVVFFSFVFLMVHVIVVWSINSYSLKDEFGFDTTMLYVGGTITVTCDKYSRPSRTSFVAHNFYNQEFFNSSVIQFKLDERNEDIVQFQISSTIQGKKYRQYKLFCLNYDLWKRQEEETNATFTPTPYPDQSDLIEVAVFVLPGVTIDRVKKKDEHCRTNKKTKCGDITNQLPYPTQRLCFNQWKNMGYDKTECLAYEFYTIDDQSSMGGAQRYIDYFLAPGHVHRAKLEPGSIINLKSDSKGDNILQVYWTNQGHDLNKAATLQCNLTYPGGLAIKLLSSKLISINLTEYITGGKLVRVDCRVTQPLNQRGPSTYFILGDADIIITCPETMWQSYWDLLITKEPSCVAPAWLRGSTPAMTKREEVQSERYTITCQLEYKLCYPVPLIHAATKSITIKYCPSTFPRPVTRPPPTTTTLTTPSSTIHTRTLTFEMTTRKTWEPLSRRTGLPTIPMESHDFGFYTSGIAFFFAGALTSFVCIHWNAFYKILFKNANRVVPDETTREHTPSEISSLPSLSKCSPPASTQTETITSISDKSDSLSDKTSGDSMSARYER